jgi:hypothetical protein
VASNYPDESLPASEGGDSRPELPFRTGGHDRPAHTEARAELRDRETYYAELRFAVHCQSRSIPAPRAALDDTWTASFFGGTSGYGEGTAKNNSIDGESWDDMIARFGDTWT